jgi:CubicO group peptidase (beta-lactamase class C family)
MFSTRRTFLKQLGLGTGALVLTSPRFQSAWAAESLGLARSTPEAEGVASAGIQAFLDGLAAARHEMHSVMIARHGRVIAEGWWTPYEGKLRHTMYSMSKSFTSTAVGLAVAEKKLTVDDKVVSFFPKDLPETVSDNLAALRIKDLLTMSVGSEREPTQDMVKEQNWVRSFLGHSITHPPGSVFMYNSAATYMCSAIVNEATGQTVLDYLMPRLFEPLGIEEPTWETCPRGIDTGGWGLSIQTEGLAKFGQLLLQKGKWNGREIIPAAWVEEATSFHIQQPEPAQLARPKEKNDWQQGYGYQFWRCQHGGYRGDGAFGQYTIVLPGQDVVIAMTGETSNMQGQLDLVWEHLLPAIKSAPLPADLATQKHLQQTLAGLALALPQGQPASPTAEHVSGKTFRLETNPRGLQSVTLDFPKGTALFTANDGTTDHVVAVGFGKWERGVTALPGTPPRLIYGGAPAPGTEHPVAASGVWKDEHTFEMTWRYYETPHHDIVTCRFDGDKVEITFASSISKGKDQRPVLKGVLSA